MPFNWSDRAGEYVQTRLAAEELVLAAARHRGLPAVAMCVSNTYGPRDWQPTPHGAMVKAAARGKMPGYVRGGAALTSNEHDFYPTLTGIRYGVANETRWGAAVGAGLEYGFAPNWSVAVQYDHMFLGEQQVGFNTVFGTSSDRISQDIDLVTARLNYRWGGPAVGRY